MAHVKGGSCRDSRAVCVVGNFWTCPTCDSVTLGPQPKMTPWGLATPVTVANMAELYNIQLGQRVMGGGVVAEINYDTGVIYWTTA